MNWEFQIAYKCCGSVFGFAVLFERQSSSYLAAIACVLEIAIVVRVVQFKRLRRERCKSVAAKAVQK